VKVALVQLDVDLAEPRERRLHRVLETIARHGDADLVVLPELWLTGYFAFDEYADTAEPLDGPTARALGGAARAAHTSVLAGSIVERDGERLHNTVLLFDHTGTLVHTQRKVHVFGYQSRETELLTGADAVTAYQGIGTATCYDLRFPEVFRLLVDQGAEVLVLPAAWPAARTQHWQLLTRARAVENQCFVLACNGAGAQAGVRLAGQSAVVGPTGDVLASAGAGEQVLEADVHVAEVHRVRADFPALRDRRFRVDPVPRQG
jgi:predicted amidohydrolase